MARKNQPTSAQRRTAGSQAALGLRAKSPPMTNAKGMAQPNEAEVERDGVYHHARVLQHGVHTQAVGGNHPPGHPDEGVGIVPEHGQQREERGDRQQDGRHVRGGGRVLPADLPERDEREDGHQQEPQQERAGVARPEGRDGVGEGEAPRRVGVDVVIAEVPGDQGHHEHDGRDHGESGDRVHRAHRAAHQPASTGRKSRERQPQTGEADYGDEDQAEIAQIVHGAASYLLGHFGIRTVAANEPSAAKSPSATTSASAWSLKLSGMAPL